MFNRVRAILELPERVNGVMRKVEGLHSHFSTVILTVQRMHGQVNELGVVTAILSNKVGSDNALSHAATRHNATIRSDYSYLLGKLGIEISPEAMNQEATYQDHSPLAKAIDSIDYLKQTAAKCLTNTTAHSSHK